MLVPPRIFRDEEEIYFTGNTRKEILVPFQSRFMDNTIVTWEKNDVPLSRVEPDFQETVPPNSTTSLILNPAKRNDSGKYRISVENRFNVIPRDIQVATICLTVRVIGESNVLLVRVVREAGVSFMTSRVRSLASLRYRTFSSDDLFQFNCIRIQQGVKMD
jgi:hypothetical protein